MLFFRRKPARQADLGWLGADLHAHLLPGIDDGAADPDTSVALVRGLADLGYRKLVATPHVLWEVYPNTPEIIHRQLALVQQELKNQGIAVELAAAAEYFIDDYFVEQVEQKAPLLCVHQKMVLTEFSMATAPYELQQVFFDLQLQGYQPLLAHPERYIYLGRHRSVFDTLHDAGVWFQLNLLSLAGHYGRSVQQLAFYLLDKGYYHFAGTDLHSLRQLEVLRKLAASDTVEKLKDYPFRNKELLGG